MRYLIVLLLLAGCATGPSADQLELNAYEAFLNEQIRKGEISLTQGQYLYARRRNEMMANRRAQQSVNDAAAIQALEQYRRSSTPVFVPHRPSQQIVCRHIGNQTICD